MTASSPPGAATTLTRAINAALPRAVPATPVAPLPAATTRRPMSPGRGPRAPSWSSLRRDAGAARALGRRAVARHRRGAAGGRHPARLAGREDWRDALWHREAVAAAEAAGYLVGVYDSYGSAHAPDQPDSWPTAQMGAEIAATAGYRDARPAGHRLRRPRRLCQRGRDRSLCRGAAWRRWPRRGQLNSYFLDVDGTGMLIADHTPGARRPSTTMAPPAPSA